MTIFVGEDEVVLAVEFALVSAETTTRLRELIQEQAAHILFRFRQGPPTHKPSLVFGYPL